MAPLQKVTTLLLIASCGAQALCKTKCGLEFEGMGDGGATPEAWSCEAVQAQEDATVVAFKNVVAPDAGDFQHACKYLNGYHVSLRAADPRLLDAGFIGYWSTSNDEWVGGETACWYNQITIAGYPHPRGSALSHELAHVVQNCKPLYHEGWQDAGIFDAINKANEP